LRRTVPLRVAAVTPATAAAAVVYPHASSSYADMSPTKTLARPCTRPADEAPRKPLPRNAAEGHVAPSGVVSCGPFRSCGVRCVVWPLLEVCREMCRVAEVCRGAEVCREVCRAAPSGGVSCVAWGRGVS